MRIVLVGWEDQDWRIYRQPQWMGELRAHPEAASMPRRHFDIEEEVYRDLLDRWGPGGLGASPESAASALHAAGAVEVMRR